MLFVVMLGGKHPRARIEVHDVVFAVADTLQATYPQLRDAWFGSPKGVHIDSWMAVDGVDGWKVELSHLAPHSDAPRLYFINLGGYEAIASAKPITTCWWSPITNKRPCAKASNRCRATGPRPTPTRCWISTIACPSTWWTAAIFTWCKRRIDRSCSATTISCCLEPAWPKKWRLKTQWNFAEK